MKARNSRDIICGLLFFAAAVYYGLSTVDCLAQPPVSSSELIKRALELDGKPVFYEGEVIAEVMNRGKYSWVNLNDGENAVGIWMGSNFLNQINFSGDYNTRGDWLRIEGVFNRSCARHGGSLDIHAQNAIKIKSGGIVSRRLVKEKHRLIFILSGVFLCLLILQLLSKRLKKVSAGPRV